MQRPTWLLLPVWVATLYAAAASAADLRYWQTPVHDITTVLAAQRTLRALGYDPGPADGTLNAKTVQAVKQAQEDRGLEPTGELDRRTLAALGVDFQGRTAPMQPRFGLRPPAD